MTHALTCLVVLLSQKALNHNLISSILELITFFFSKSDITLGGSSGQNTSWCLPMIQLAIAGHKEDLSFLQIGQLYFSLLCVLSWIAI